MSSQTGQAIVLDVSAIGDLIRFLKDDGYRVVGPTVADGAIVYDEIGSDHDLPRGWTDEQEAGHYRIRRRPDEALFGYPVGPKSLKSWFFPSSLRLWSAKRTGDGFEVEAGSTEQEPPRTAFLGARPCELAALSIQDRIFDNPQRRDPWFKAMRERSFMVAVQCTVAGETCFCASMNSGPRAEGGYDLALTEVLDEERHDFLCEIGSDRGAQAVAALESRPATDADRRQAVELAQACAASMKRSVDTSGLKEDLAQKWEHARWEDVASRCFACANCTMVCPTCFCITVEDVNDLTKDHTERWRKWDSCTTADHSYIHGGTVRTSIQARYRQWLTHKFCTWVDQFDTFGCVGCGRCITWCPGAIDITREVAALRATDGTTV